MILKRAMQSLFPSSYVYHELKWDGNGYVPVTSSGKERLTADEAGFHIRGAEANGIPYIPDPGEYVFPGSPEPPEHVYTISRWRYLLEMERLIDDDALNALKNGYINSNSGKNNISPLQ